MRVSPGCLYTIKFTEDTRVVIDGRWPRLNTSGWIPRGTIMHATPMRDISESVRYWTVLVVPGLKFRLALRKGAFTYAPVRRYRYGFDEGWGVRLLHEQSITVGEGEDYPLLGSSGPDNIHRIRTGRPSQHAQANTHEKRKEALRRAAERTSEPESS